MFSKTERPEAASMPSIIANGTSVQGDLNSEGDIQIEGRVTGDVTCRRLTIGQQGVVDGRIEGEVVHVHGAVSGEIHGENVVVASSARISGDIYHDAIAVETGGQIEGRLVRRGPEPAALNLVTDQSSSSTRS